MSQSKIEGFHEAQLRAIELERTIKHILNLTEKMWEEVALVRVEIDKGLTPWLDKDQAAAYIGMSRSSMNRYMDQIPYSKATGRPKFHRKDLDAFMASQVYLPGNRKPVQLIPRKKRRRHGL